jgi:pimeloyl-ACP methyl ester carboxylesterase
MRRLEANGTTIAYARTGAGPPIELMHGAEADHSMFAPLAAQLKKQLTVIAYDQRDSGDTRNPRQPCTLKDMGDDAAALIKGLAIEKAHVYGTSFGSLIAQSLAIRHPECVDRLVLSAAIRIGKTLRDIAPETARRLQELRADRVKNAERIARIFYPEPHPAAHPAAIEPFKIQRRTLGSNSGFGPARAEATTRFVQDHGAGAGARWPRGSLGSVRSFVCRLPKKSQGHRRQSWRA